MMIKYTRKKEIDAQMQKLVFKARNDNIPQHKNKEKLSHPLQNFANFLVLH